MNLIDLYINAVIAKLPQERKADAAEELRAKINGMLPADPSEEDVRKVLQNLGDPQLQAKNYDTRQRYLIGPDYYDNYISILKLVIGILITVMALVTVLTWIISPPDGGIVQFFTDLFTAMVGGAVQAATWVTVIFVIMERSKVAIPPIQAHGWTVDDLSKDKSKGVMIKRSDVFVSIFFTITFTAILYFRPELLSFYYRSGGSYAIVPIFDLERLQDFMPLIIIIALLELVISIWKIINRRWNLSLAIANAVRYSVGMVFWLVMLWNRAIINPDFASEVSQHTRFSAASIDRSLEITVWVIIAATVVSWISESIRPFVKLAKNK
ncbi:MAG: hypothetical protein PHR78_04185 [Eubacteriales bacterium]|nr:hypothetical protein [Eubacteriales bacterium]MDD4324682.1 hypothetical protein [Eubacteriales bacterium]MDD4541347.1 hypothetical protein [Eubacteriales bacterium]